MNKNKELRPNSINRVTYSYVFKCRLYDKFFEFPTKRFYNKLTIGIHILDLK